MNPESSNSLYHQIYTLLWFMGPGFKVRPIVLLTVTGFPNDTFTGLFGGVGFKDMLIYSNIEMFASRSIEM